MNDAQIDSGDKQFRRFRVGLLVAVLFHGLVVVLLVAIPLRIWRKNSSDDVAATNSSSTLDAPAKLPEEPTETEFLDPKEALDREAEDKVLESIEESKQLSDEENQSRLDDLTKQLNQLSNEKNVEKMASNFYGWLGTKPRASRPGEQPVEGGFDYDTGQLHDVTREKTDAGKWKYRGVLLDAKGRTMEFDMDEKHGERTYKTFKRLKANPLLDKVYRNITMPLLDKLSGKKKKSDPPPKIKIPIPDIEN